jgi:hypothetical protein
MRKFQGLDRARPCQPKTSEVPVAWTGRTSKSRVPLKERRFTSTGVPLLTSRVGHASGCSFLGVVGMIGASYEDDHVATGFGNHLARPIFRSEHRPDMTEASGCCCFLLPCLADGLADLTEGKFDCLLCYLRCMHQLPWRGRSLHPVLPPAGSSRRVSQRPKSLRQGCGSNSQSALWVHVLVSAGRAFLKARGFCGVSSSVCPLVRCRTKVWPSWRSACGCSTIGTSRALTR